MLPAHEVLGISNISCKSERYTLSHYLLTDEVLHKVGIIKTYLQDSTVKPQQRPIAIAGHSVGAWVLQRVVTSLSDYNFKSIGLITPTIVDIHKSNGGVKLTFINRIMPFFNVLVSGLSFLLSVLPNVLITPIVQMLLSRNNENSNDANLIETTKKLITSPTIVKNCLGLAADEMVHIRANWEFQDDFFLNNGIKKWIFFTNNDNWVSNTTRDQMMSRYGDCEDISFIRNDKIPHNFSINHYNELAQLTAEQVEL